MRERVLCETLPFLLRLLRISLGPTATSGIISEYRKADLAKPCGAEDARQFIGYVRARALPIPHLINVLDLEDALHATSNQERIVSFDCDPTLLFAALQDERPPGVLPKERFYIAVAQHGIVITKDRETSASPPTPESVSSPPQ